VATEPRAPIIQTPIRGDVPVVACMVGCAS